MPRKEGGFYYWLMIAKRILESKLGKALLGSLFALVALMGVAVPVYAVPGVEETAEIRETTDVADEGDAVENLVENPVETTETAETSGGTVADKMAAEAEKEGKSCNDSLGSLGWLVCPATGKISEAVEWLYDKIEETLVINPVSMEDGAPIYEIWKFMRGIAQETIRKGYIDRTSALATPLANHFYGWIKTFHADGNIAPGNDICTLRDMFYRSESGVPFAETGIYY